MTYDIEQITHLIRNRRSIYPAQYTGEKIDDELVEGILENANWAPTHKHTEPWRFKVFTGAGLKRLFTEMAHIYRENNTGEKFKQDKYDKFFHLLPERVSHAIAICMRRDERESIPEFEEIAAVACAVQNIHLTVTALGLAGYWSTGNGSFSPQMKEFLELGEKDRCLGFFYLGKTDKTVVTAKRTPIEEKTQWIQ